MKKLTKIALATAVVVTPIAGYAATQNLDDADGEEAEMAPAIAPLPAVSREDAQRIASGLAKGDLLEAEHEYEDGTWRWSLEFRENVVSRHH